MIRHCISAQTIPMSQRTYPRAIHPIANTFPDSLVVSNALLSPTRRVATSRFPPCDRDRELAPPLATTPPVGGPGVGPQLGQHLRWRLDRKEGVGFQSFQVPDGLESEVGRQDATAVEGLLGDGARFGVPQPCE